jgi:uncharacterized membrane protein YphA (DoxX/SURF4 family)
MTRIAFGRNVYGVGAAALGVIALIWHDPSHWQQLLSLGNLPGRESLVYIAAAVLILGGIAIQWPRTARAGAVVLGAIYLIFALLLVPAIAAKPQELYRWLNCFYELSLVAGAVIVYESVRRTDLERATRAVRFGCILFGISNVSFAAEQVEFLSRTASLVPKWMPPGQMFWAIATAIAFALAGIAIIFGRAALLASRCLTAMLIGFVLLVWLPVCVAAPHDFGNWSEGLETLAIAGAAWIVADFLNHNRSTSSVSRPHPPTLPFS